MVRLMSHSKVTLNLNVDSHVANAHIFTGLPQRKGINPTFCQMYTEIKYVKNVSCVGHLSSVNLVNNAPHAVIDPPVGARLHQCWEKWEALGSSPKVVTTLKEGYTLPFRFRPHLTRSHTVLSNYHNSAKQSFLVEALYQLINKNAVEPVENQNSLGSPSDKSCMVRAMACEIDRLKVVKYSSSLTACFIFSDDLPLLSRRRVLS